MASIDHARAVIGGIRRQRSRAKRFSLCMLAVLPAMFGFLASPPVPAAAATYALTLTASSLTVNAGQAVTLTATAVPTPPLDYYIDIEDTGNSITLECRDANPCSQSFTYPI